MSFYFSAQRGSTCVHQHEIACTTANTTTHEKDKRRRPRSHSGPPANSQNNTHAIPDRNAIAVESNGAHILHAFFERSGNTSSSVTSIASCMSVSSKRAREDESTDEPESHKRMRVETGVAAVPDPAKPTLAMLRARFSQPTLPRNAHARDANISLDTSWDEEKGERRHDY